MDKIFLKKSSVLIMQNVCDILDLALRKNKQKQYTNLEIKHKKSFNLLQSL